MKKFSLVVIVLTLALAATACQAPIVKCWEVPNFKPLQFVDTICVRKHGDYTFSCAEVIIATSIQCTSTKGWAYKPALYITGVGEIENYDFLPGAKRTFTIPENSEVFFDTTFLYTPQHEFYSDFISVIVNNEEWTISRDGLLLSPRGESIVPAGTEITIQNLEGIEHLTKETQLRFKSLFSLIEAIVP